MPIPYLQNARDGKAHGKVQFLLGAKCAKCDSVSYCTILNVKRFGVALKHVLFKMRKNAGNFNAIVVILRLKVVSATFLLVCFVSLKDNTIETRKKNISLRKLLSFMR